MRWSRAGWGIVSLAVVAAFGCAPGSSMQTTHAVDQAAITAAVDSINTAFAAAVAARDTNAIAAFYADDAHLMPANMARLDGRDAVRSGWAGFLQMPGMELTPTSNTKIISEAGDLVVDLGSYTMKGTDPAGKPFTDNGKYVTVIQKVNGEWKIVVDTFNSDMPMPGM